MLTYKDKIILEVILPLIIKDADAKDALKATLKSSFEDIRHEPNPKDVTDADHLALQALAMAFETKQIDASSYKFFQEAAYKMKTGQVLSIDKILSFAGKLKFEKGTHPALKSLALGLVDQSVNPYDFIKGVYDIIVSKNLRDDVDPLILKATKKILGMADEKVVKEEVEVVEEAVNKMSPEQEFVYDNDRFQDNLLRGTQASIKKQIYDKLSKRPLPEFEKYLNGSKDAYPFIIMEFVENLFVKGSKFHIPMYLDIIDEHAKKIGKKYTASQGYHTRAIHFKDDIAKGDFKDLELLLKSIEKNSSKDTMVAYSFKELFANFIATKNALLLVNPLTVNPRAKALIDIFGKYEKWKEVVSDLASGSDEKARTTKAISIIRTVLDKEALGSAVKDDAEISTSKKRKM